MFAINNASAQTQLFGRSDQDFIGFLYNYQADLNTIIKNCKVLENRKQLTLLKLLNKFKHLFDGTLGHWKTKLVNLVLKHVNTKLCPTFKRKSSKTILQ